MAAGRKGGDARADEGLCLDLEPMWCQHVGPQPKNSLCNDMMMSQSFQFGSTLKEVIKTYSSAKIKWGIICQYVQNSLCAGRPHTHPLTSDPKGSTNWKHVTMIHVSKHDTCDVLNESDHRRNLLQEYVLCYQRKIPIDSLSSGICCVTKSNIPGQGQAGSGPERCPVCSLRWRPPVLLAWP